MYVYFIGVLAHVHANTFVYIYIHSVYMCIYSFIQTYARMYMLVYR